LYFLSTAVDYQHDGWQIGYDVIYNGVGIAQIAAAPTNNGGVLESDDDDDNYDDSDIEDLANGSK